MSAFPRPADRLLLPVLSLLLFASATRSAVFSIFMEAWRSAHRARLSEGR